jgi:hypothetical protein
MGGELYLIFSLIIGWVIIELLIGRWMFKAKPDKRMIEKYPKKVIIASSLPFGTSWKKKVEKNHIAILEAYQFRVRICFLSIILALLGFYSYISFRF